MDLHQQTEDTNMNYEVKFDGTKKTAGSLTEASKMFRDWIDLNDFGASNLKASDGHLFKDGKRIGFISYNGRVWEGDPRKWNSSTKEMFDKA